MQIELDKLVASLAEMLEGIKEDFTGRETWRYGSFEKAILEHGVSAPPKPRPPNIKRGVPTHCYYNCQQLVLKYQSLTYVEGYAVPQGFKFLMPINHAWVLDADGKVIDPTWEPFGICYLGIPMTTEWLKTVWDARYLKDPDGDITIFQGSYMDDFWIVKEGFPAGALTKIS